jgi:replicative DNA helicase
VDRRGIEMKLIVGKQRNGPTGDIPVVFMRPYAKFANVAHVQRGEME